MSFILNLQGIDADNGRAPAGAEAAYQPSTYSLSTCFSNASWALC